MSAANDLRELEAEVDAAMTGWPRPTYTFMTTVAGRRLETAIRSLRAKLFRGWSERMALRARLSRALCDVHGLRAANELLTAELERLRGP